MTNAAAIDYGVLAAQEIGLTPEQISRLSSAINRIMDFVDEGEAETVYRETP